MRVLIAGATGVIGRQAVPRLATAGHDVIGLSRSPRPSAEAQHVTTDLLDADALATAVRSAAPDAVVHLATAIPDPVHPRHIARDMARTNRLQTEGTANLIVAARAAGAGRIVAHSLAYAHDPAAAAICSEDQRLWRKPPRQYAPAVAALRELERRVLDADGMVLRLGHLYGPGSTYAADGATTAQIRKGKLPVVGAGSAIFSFIHADDAATAVVAALERDLCDVLNVFDGEPVRMAARDGQDAGLSGTQAHPAVGGQDRRRPVRRRRRVHDGAARCRQPPRPPAPRLGARTSQLARAPHGRARPSSARGMTGEGAGTAGARCTVAPIAGGPADAEA